METYKYKCGECQNVYENFPGANKDHPDEDCPCCGADLKKSKRVK